MLKFCLFIIIFPNFNYAQYCNTTIQEPYTVSIPQTYKKFFKEKTRYINETAYRPKTIFKCCNGYKNISGECLPICNNECVNGLCIGPGICKCLEGYQITSSNFTCELICENCTHGQCLHPNECQCFAGYAKNENGICSPECLEECGNGYCSAPDECSCLDGYEFIDNEEKDSNQCNPICKSGCENGYCIKPETCECFKGYQKSILGNCTRIEKNLNHFTTEFDASTTARYTENISTKNINSQVYDEVYKKSSGNHLMLIILLPLVGIVLLSSIFLLLKRRNICIESNMTRIQSEIQRRNSRSEIVCYYTTE